MYITILPSLILTICYKVIFDRQQIQIIFIRTKYIYSSSKSVFFLQNYLQSPVALEMKKERFHGKVGSTRRVTHSRLW